MTKNKDARAPREGLDKNKSGWTSMPVLNESEIEAVTDTYTQEDQARSKTWSRRIVENYLQHVSEAYCLLYDDEFGIYSCRFSPFPNGCARIVLMVLASKGRY